MATGASHGAPGGKRLPEGAGTRPQDGPQAARRRQADRPDEAVQVYGLDAETEARVYAEAEAQILAEGGKRGLIPRMHIQRVMADLLAQRQGVYGVSEEGAPCADIVAA